MLFRSLVFAQYQEGKLNPAGIVSMFTEEKQQREIAELFHTSLRELTSPAEKEKALRETIIRLKENSINFRSKHLEPTDMAGLQKLVADKKSVQKLYHMDFGISDGK